ncbi:MAG: DinB family protein [Phycisphaerae bacterium]|jgi:hypothetical protein
MAKWPWIERTFHFDYPPTKFPDLIERLRGTPPRIEARVAGLSAAVLTRSDGKGWSIQQNIGHLLDTEELPMKRIDQILAGEAGLRAADMSNKRTNLADHNDKHIEVLLDEFRRARAGLVDRFEELSETDWRKSGLHPRLNQPMRIVDIAYFTSEHDDYHLARIAELIRTLR